MSDPYIVDPPACLAKPPLKRVARSDAIAAAVDHQRPDVADTDAVVGAEWGPALASRTTQRNGYRHRDLDTRVGTIDVAIPKLPKGTYFPERLLERRKRSESALITVVADCYEVRTERAEQLTLADRIGERWVALREESAANTRDDYERALEDVADGATALPSSSRSTRRWGSRRRPATPQRASRTPLTRSPAWPGRPSACRRWPSPGLRGRHGLPLEVQVLGADEPTALRAAVWIERSLRAE